MLFLIFLYLLQQIKGPLVTLKYRLQLLLKGYLLTFTKRHLTAKIIHDYQKDPDKLPAVSHWTNAYRSQYYVTSTPMKLAHRATVDSLAEVTQRLKKIVTEEKLRK